MSELARLLLAAIQRGPIHFADLWEQVDASWTFDEMQSALAELKDLREISQIDATFAFCLAEAA